MASGMDQALQEEVSCMRVLPRQHTPRDKRDKQRGIFLRIDKGHTGDDFHKKTKTLCFGFAVSAAAAAAANPKFVGIKQGGTEPRGANQFRDQGMQKIKGRRVPQLMVHSIVVVVD